MLLVGKLLGSGSCICGENIDLSQLNAIISFGQLNAM